MPHDEQSQREINHVARSYQRLIQGMVRDLQLTERQATAAVARTCKWLEEDRAIAHHDGNPVAWLDDIES